VMGDPQVEGGGNRWGLTVFDSTVIFDQQPHQNKGTGPLRLRNGLVHYVADGPDESDLDDAFGNAGNAPLGFWSIDTDPGTDTEVRVDAGRDTLTLEGPDAVLIGPPRTAEPDRCRTPLTLVHRNDRWHIDGRPELAWRGPLALADPEGGALPLGDRRYPERLILVPRPDLPPFDKTRDRFDVVNHVHLEAYLPGVLDKELYPGWRPTTFYAQAIAARSYAIHHMLHAAADRHYDVESTQASQVYGRLRSVCGRFLDYEPGLLGVIRSDRAVRASVLDRRPVTLGRPRGAVARQFHTLAVELGSRLPSITPS